MTNQQQNTIDRIIAKIERANGQQTISILDYKKGHILLCIFNVRDKIDAITETTFCDVQINTKGNIVKGFLNALTPIITTKYPYINL